MRTMSALLIVCTAVALSACGSSYSSGSSGSSSGSSTGTSSTSSGSGGSNGYGKAPSSSSTSASSTSGSNEIDMVDYAFKPKVITGKPGQTVKITLKNTGQAEHNFKIDGQSADADVQPGQTASVKVQIP